MDNRSAEAFHLGELMSKILRLKNINNNNSSGGSGSKDDETNDYCCESNGGGGGCHAMKPRDAQNDGNYEVIEEVDNVKKEIVDESGLGENMAAGDVPAAKSNNSSSNNSTDNLSITEDDDEEDIEDVEVLLLANQQFLDDELSENSDDCVYAYRGADFDILEYRNNNNIEDETDFLEMDFEPDPASEIDSTNECNGGVSIGMSCVPGNGTNNPNRNFNSGHHNNSSHHHVPVAGLPVDEFISPFQKVDEVTQKSSKFTNNLSHDEIMRSKRNNSNISADDEDHEHFRITGAKPKRQQQTAMFDKTTAVGKLSSTPQRKYQTSSPAPESPDTKTTNASSFASPPAKTAIGGTINDGGNTANCDDLDEACIDCLENEFLSTTIGRKMDTAICRKCRKAIGGRRDEGLGTEKTYESILDFTTDFSRILPRLENVERQKENGENFGPLEQHVESVNLLKRTGKESVTFSSVNVDEKVIIQALDHINIDFNKDIIKRHLEAIYNEQPHFDNVADLILYISKRNCDYKKIMKLIALACNEEIDIKFTRDENVSKETEIVQVRSCDILEMWTIQSNLERLKKLNKKFVQMNILGKVINLIRHAQQRNTKSVEEFIVVPQYYKTGYICITKK